MELSVRWGVVLIVGLLLVHEGRVNGQNLQLGDTYVQIKNNRTSTEVFVTSKLATGILPSDAWLGLGFNNIEFMPGANVVVCRNGPNENYVQQYVNSNGYSQPVLIDNMRKSIGLSNMRVEIVQDNFTCYFVRDNLVLVNNYFPVVGDNSYVLLAFGSGSLSYHKSNRFSKQIQFAFVGDNSTTTTISTTPTTTIAPLPPKPAFNQFISSIINIFNTILNFFKL